MKGYSPEGKKQTLWAQSCVLGAMGKEGKGVWPSPKSSGMASRQITPKKEISAIASGIVAHFPLSIGLFLSHGQICKLIHQLGLPFLFGC